MLDINLFRDDKEFKKILESEKRRNKPLDFAKDTKKFDDLWRKAKQEKEELRAEKNKITKGIATVAQDKNTKNEQKTKDITRLKVKSKTLDIQIKELENKETTYLQARDENRYKVGNILYPTVPNGKSDEENVPFKFWGKAKVQKQHLADFKKASLGKMDYSLLDFEPKSHADLGPERGLFDLERAAKISGARAYYLKGKLTILHLSLLRFALDKLVEAGYMPLYTPFLINKDVMEKAAELADFKETLYQTTEGQFLIATAEQTLAAYHMDEVLDEKILPLKYAGYSSAFRREAGSAGKDTRGIFRVHQFDKVEQYVFCKAKDNEKIHEELLKNAESIYKELEIPYRVVNICTGDMNDTAAKKYDIELWMPVQGKFREIGSYSITTDYQTRKLNVRYEEKGERIVFHSLNGTALPSPRSLAAFIENHQTKDYKIKIPKALQKYTGFKEI